MRDCLVFLGGISFLGLVLYVLEATNNILPALLLFYRACSYVSSAFHKGRDAVYIQDQINRIGRRIDSESDGGIPHVPRIRWVVAKGVDRIADNEVIICLPPGEPRSHSLVKATLQYLPKGMVPECRPYMPAGMSQAMDLAVAREIVATDTESQGILMTDYVGPLTGRDQEVSKWFGIYDRLLAKGFFSRIVLPELARLGRYLYPVVAPSDETRAEAAEIAYFVNRIARRGEHEEIPLVLPGRSVKTSAILFARSQILDTYGEAAHWWRLKRNLRLGLQTVYLIAWTPRGMEAASVVAARALREGLLSGYREKRFGRLGPSGETQEDLVIACSIGDHIEDAPQTAEERLVDIFDSLVPELPDGLAEVVATVREQGRMSVIAVRSLRDGFDAVARLREAVPRASWELGGEEIRVIPWAEDPCKVIMWALQLQRVGKYEIVPDGKHSECLVAVDGEEALEMVRGRDGVAIHLANKLTGWRIMTETMDGA